MLRGHVLLRQAVTAFLPAAFLLARSTALNLRPSRRSSTPLFTQQSRPLLTRVKSTFGAGAPAEKKRITRKAAPKTQTKANAAPSKRQRKQTPALEDDVKPKKKATTSPAAPKLVVSTPSELPPRIRLADKESDGYHDLASFVDFCRLRNKNLDSPWYQGRHYEYQVEKTLQKWRFKLARVGKSSDGGIDLIGNWLLPGASLKVIIQCKDSKTRPGMIREMAGSFPAAAAGWNSQTALAMLVASTPISPGTRKELERSTIPMAFMQIDASGEPRQVMWNKVAAAAHLDGLSVIEQYRTVVGSPDVHGDEVQKTAALYWREEPLATKIAKTRGSGRPKKAN